MSKGPKNAKAKLARLKAAGASRKTTGGGPVPVTPEDTSGSAAGGSADRVDSLKKRMAALRKSKAGTKASGGAAKKRKKGVWEAPERFDLPGEILETKWGPVRRVVSHLPLKHHHGEFSVGTALKATGAGVSRLALDDELAEFSASEALFIDTETTGLAGGAGTIPFLIGIGFFTDEGFRVEQLVLEEMGREKPVMRYLARKIEKATSVVSFNGKSYDWPLLRTRFVLNRVKVPQLPPHFDLLHSSRRIFKHQLTETKLTTLEREVLGFRRVGDIPGSEIPQRYFNFLSTGDGNLLAAIVEHNLHDIVAMAALLGVVHSLILAPDNAVDSRVQLAVAQLQWRVKDTATALEFVNALCAGDADSRYKCEALVLGATVLRRQSSFTEAVLFLKRAVELPGTSVSERAPVHLMLSKLYEHQLKEFSCALEHAEKARGAEALEDSSRRIARVRAKKERSLKNGRRC